MKLCWLLSSVAILLAAAPRPERLSIVPSNPLLFGKDARQALAVLAHFADGSTRDVTEQAVLRSQRPAVAAVEGSRIRALGDGAAAIVATYGGRAATTTALVQQAAAPLPAGFLSDVMTVLTKYGCNGGSCHGSLNGQNGFKLSLFGYEPAADWEMVVRAHDGRRIHLAQPESSLLLRKPTFQEKHGGGKLLRQGSDDYNLLLSWLRAGAPPPRPQDRRIRSLRVLPASPVLYGKGATSRVLVTARFSDGTEADVTALVRFQSNDESIVAVSPDGRITAGRGGETAIVVRAPGLAAAARLGVVAGGDPLPRLEANNYIDEAINAKLRALRIPPSEPADDATFLRRACLDITGVIPTAAEARQFLTSSRPDKRAELVHSLLQRPEYADHWALYWGDHLSNTRQLLYNKGPYTFTRWLYDQFRRNVPYDRFVRSLLVSSGNMYDNPATSYYPLMKKELDLAAVTSQLFLGISIDCARCHNHPLERWTQADFNGMAAFFSQIRYKNAGPRNNERVLYLDFARQFVHPDTGQAHAPKPLAGAVMAADPWTDRREQLADWLTSPQNPWFARAMANRLWRLFMGRGLVEPVDDFRATNPASNEELLDALARDFVEHHYDIHHLIRRITASRAYQRSSAPKPGNREDTMAYSRYYPKRLGAEALLDSIAVATGVDEKYHSLYPGTRAAQLPEPEIESFFLEVFDRPSRQNVCERKNAPTLNQTLHLIAGDTIHSKVTAADGVLARRLRSGMTPDAIVEELYLGTVSRFPTPEERALARQAFLRAGDPRRGAEDVFWALLNSKEFIYNH